MDKNLIYKNHFYDKDLKPIPQGVILLDYVSRMLLCVVGIALFCVVIKIIVG